MTTPNFYALFYNCYNMLQYRNNNLRRR